MAHFHVPLEFLFTKLLKPTRPNHLSEDRSSEYCQMLQFGHDHKQKNNGDTAE